MTLSFGNTPDRVNLERVLAVAAWLDKNPFPGMRDVVTAYSSVTVVYDLYMLCRETGLRSGQGYVRDVLGRAIAQTEAVQRTGVFEGNVLRIPVCYDDEFAPDLPFVMSHAGLSREEVLRLHSAHTYTVYMVGFLPGFPYMAALPEALSVPRKATPASRVEAGSVGIAGVQTGIYPLPSPGGWQVIGRTPQVMFDASRTPPVALKPGDQVCFFPISRREFDDRRYTP